MIINIDLDGVICTEERTFERALARPLPGTKEALAHLVEQGHTIVIYSARSWSELRLTENWLKTHGIPYHGIHFGKPVADRFIDDRAVRFMGDWDSVIADLKGEAPPFGFQDEGNLRLLREDTKRFLEEIARRPDLEGPVLEVGPMDRQSAVFRRMPETYIDTAALFRASGLEYSSMDTNPDIGADYVCDLLDAERTLDGRTFKTIILLSCIEHIPRVWEVPRALQSVLSRGGRAFILTPWNIRFHGPRPDCWRISDDGYEALFKGALTIESLEKIPCPGRPLNPIGLRCIVRKD
jgi:hypothetical protein